MSRRRAARGPFGGVIFFVRIAAILHRTFDRAIDPRSRASLARGRFPRPGIRGRRRRRRAVWRRRRRRPRRRETRPVRRARDALADALDKLFGVFSSFDLRAYDVEGAGVVYGVFDVVRRARLEVARGHRDVDDEFLAEGVLLGEHAVVAVEGHAAHVNLVAARVARGGGGSGGGGGERANGEGKEDAGTDAVGGHRDGPAERDGRRRGGGTARAEGGKRLRARGGGRSRRDSREGTPARHRGDDASDVSRGALCAGARVSAERFRC